MRSSQTDETNTKDPSPKKMDIAEIFKYLMYA